LLRLLNLHRGIGSRFNPAQSENLRKSTQQEQNHQSKAWAFNNPGQWRNICNKIVNNIQRSYLILTAIGQGV